MQKYTTIKYLNIKGIFPTLQNQDTNEKQSIVKYLQKLKHALPSTPSNTNIFSLFCTKVKIFNQIK